MKMDEICDRFLHVPIEKENDLAFLSYVKLEQRKIPRKVRFFGMHLNVRDVGCTATICCPEEDEWT